LSTNWLCSPSLNFIFFFFIYWRSAKKSTQYKINKYYYHNPFLNLKKHPRIFVQLSLQTSKRNHLEKVKIYFCNFPILFTSNDPVRKARYTNTKTWATFRAIFWDYFSFNGNTNVKFKATPNSRNSKESQLILRKWKNSSCIINHLTNNIPTVLH